MPPVVRAWADRTTWDGWCAKAGKRRAVTRPTMERLREPVRLCRQK